jgi:hypothetical protein
LIWLLMASPLLVPLLIYGIVRRFAGWAPWSAVIAAALGGAGCGAFLLSAAAAMASAYSGSEASMRGFAVGFMFGAMVGVVCYGGEALWRKLRPRNTPPPDAD